jgi:hypothetical protein
LAQHANARRVLRTAGDYPPDLQDPQGSNRVGLILEIPDFGKFQEAMQSDEAAEAMKRDGVHPDTLVVLEEA